MGVLAIGDQSTDDARIGERRADDARRARGKLAHRIIEVGDGASPSVEHRDGLLRTCVRMAEADNDPGFRHAPDELQGDRRWGEGDDHHARARRDERVRVCFKHRADELGRMHALAPGIDERPLDMDSQRAGHTLARLASDGQRCVKNAWRIGHDRRQERGHASKPMRGGDCGDSLDGWIGVEQYAAAAIDLPIDEARA